MLSNEEIEDNNSLPFALNDVTELFLTGAEIANSDPERAVFLYQRVLELAPDHNNGQTREFVRREEKRLLPRRLQLLSMKAENHIKSHEWEQAKQSAEDMNKLAPGHREANELISRYNRNVRCDPLYANAIVAAQTFRWNAVDSLMKHIQEQCPEYGDPQNILAQKPK